MEKIQDEQKKARRNVRKINSTYPFIILYYIIKILYSFYYAGFLFYSLYNSKYVIKSL